MAVAGAADGRVLLASFTHAGGLYAHLQLDVERTTGPVGLAVQVGQRLRVVLRVLERRTRGTVVNLIRYGSITLDTAGLTVSIDEVSGFAENVASNSTQTAQEAEGGEALVALMSDAAFYANEIPPGAQVRLSWDEGRLHRLQA